MITVEQARRLRLLAPRWEPASGDRFVIPDTDLDEVFVIAEMTIGPTTLPALSSSSMTITEWALDSIVAESPLASARTSWDAADLRLRPEVIGDGFAVELTGRQPLRDTDPERAYARAAIAWPTVAEPLNVPDFLPVPDLSRSRTPSRSLSLSRGERPPSSLQAHQPSGRSIAFRWSSLSRLDAGAATHSSGTSSNRSRRGGDRRTPERVRVTGEQRVALQPLHHCDHAVVPTDAQVVALGHVVGEHDP